MIFGAWDTEDDGSKVMILDEEWATLRDRRQPGYPQSREHIRLVEEEGYRLLTFPMQQSRTEPGNDESAAKIAGFTPKLSERELIRVGTGWYAVTDGLMPMPEEVRVAELLTEGAARTVQVNSYERNPEARRRCLEHYGHRCIVCDFSFEDRYGSIGRCYIHVHHLVPLSEIGEEYEVDPLRDLVPVCPNCHAMIHAVRPMLSIEQLHDALRDD
nr:HNH endonuclease [Algiphilus aromaticivorans]